jgi:hypothetical protein
MIRQDYLLRLIEQLKQALARILRQRDEQQHDDALDTLVDAYDELLGHRPEALAMLAPESAAMMLEKGVKLRVYAALLQAEAGVLSARAAPRDAAAALALRQRALRVVLLGLRRSERGDPPLGDLARALLGELGGVALDATTQRDLKALGIRR